MNYSLKVAFLSLWRERWINLLSVLTMAMGLLVIITVFLSIYNLDLLTKKLPEKFSVLTYLKDGVSEQEVQNIAASLRGRPAVENVRFISKSEALKELKASMRDADYVLEGVDENPLPASIEIRLKREAVGPDSVRQFVSEIKKIKGIDEVQYGEKFLLSIHSIKTGVQAVGLVLLVIMTAGMIFICYSSIKLLFYRRREEIETLKLLGATRGFIRIPFIMEGGAIGLAAGISGMFIVSVFYYGVFYKLSTAIPVMKAVMLPVMIPLSLPFAGLSLGIAGALIAVGRIKY